MEILVYADWFELKGPAPMGVLSVTHVKGREVFSFAYDKDWLKKGQAQMLDPDHPLSDAAGPAPSGEHPTPRSRNTVIPVPAHGR